MLFVVFLATKNTKDNRVDCEHNHVSTCDLKTSNSKKCSDWSTFQKRFSTKMQDGKVGSNPPVLGFWGQLVAPKTNKKKCLQRNCICIRKCEIKKESSNFFLLLYSRKKLLNCIRTNKQLMPHFLKLLSCVFHVSFGRVISFVFLLIWYW